jgi:hypothetical protein
VFFGAVDGAARPGGPALVYHDRAYKRVCSRRKSDEVRAGIAQCSIRPVRAAFRCATFDVQALIPRPTREEQ